MNVRARLERERGAVRTLVLAAGLALSLAAGALLLAVSVLLLGGGRWIGLPAPLPFVVWGGVLACVALVAWSTRRWLRASHDRAAVARAVEREQRLRDGSLLGVLEVPESALARRAEARLDAELECVRGTLAPSLHRAARRRGAAAGGVALTALSLLVLAAATSGDGWTALAHPARAWAGTLVDAPRITGLPPAVMRGQALTVNIDAPGRREVTLWHRATGGGWMAERLRVRDGRAALSLVNVDADLLLVASDGRARSDTASVAVTDRPFLADITIRAIYPGYLEREPEMLVPGDPLRVPRGTELQLSGTSTTALRGVRLAAGDDTLALSTSAHRFEGRLLAERDARWSWVATAQDGEAPEVPASLDVSVIADEAPVVEIVSPARDSQVLAGDRVELAARAADDHGLASVTVRSWRLRNDGSMDPEVTHRAGVSGQPYWSGAILLDLAERGLQPGDELRVVVSATDDSPWRQTTASRELVLRVPSLADQRSNARAAADSAVARALAAASAQRQLAQRTEDAARARDRGGASQRADGATGAGQQGAALSFEGAERARTLAAEQRQLAEEVARMREASQRLEQQLDRAGALDPELQARLREARQLMQEALTPRLAEQLRKLEESARELQPEATRQALGDLAEQQRQMREQLARAAEMLRRAALEGSMETLRDEAAELASAQQQLADAAGDAPRQDAGAQRGGEIPPQQAAPSPSGGSTPQELARRTEQLARDVERLRERLAEQKAGSGEQRTSEAGRHADASAEAMARAARQAESNPAQPSSPGQRMEQPSVSLPRQSGAQQQGGQQSGAQQSGAQQSGAQQQGAQQSGAQQSGAQQGGQKQDVSTGRSGGAGQQGSGAAGGGMRQDAARAAEEMRRTAEQLASARSEQVAEWKSELTAELDRAVNELQQMSREQRALEQRTREGAEAGQVRGQQGALQQGVQGIAQRLQEEGRRSSLLSQGSQQAVATAQRQVQQATQQAAVAAGEQGGARAAQASQMADAMASAARAMNDAAASLVRDRARANAAGSATGLAELLEEMQRLAAQQGGINAQSSSLLPGTGGQRPSASAMAQARELARQQRAIARELEGLGDGSGDSDSMADEARNLARALESGALDPSTINRQQRLFRRMLDAGRALEEDEVDDSAPRRGETARSTDRFTPTDSAVSGRAAERYPVPTWEELRQLSPEDRRVVMEYFRRLNATTPDADRQGARQPAPAGSGRPGSRR